MRPGEWGPRLRLAAERFGVTPEGFWRLSLVEWRALTEAATAEALSRTRFEALAREHPDD